MPKRWCTVTVVDAEGRRHSLDLQASSSFDPAELYVTQAKAHPERGLPLPSVFEVVIGGKMYRVEGRALQRWIVDHNRLAQEKP